MEMWNVRIGKCNKLHQTEMNTGWESPRSKLALTAVSGAVQEKLCRATALQSEVRVLIGTPSSPCTSFLGLSCDT